MESKDSGRCGIHSKANWNPAKGWEYLNMNQRAFVMRWKGKTKHK